MAIAENAPEDRATPTGGARLDLVEQLIGEVGVLGRQIVRHPVAVEHEVARLAAQFLHGQTRALLKAGGAADGMDAAQESAHPFALVASPEFRPAPAAAWENGIAKAVVDVQRHAVAKQGRHHRNFLRGQFTGKGVFLANRGIGPAARTIEFGDHRLAILDADLIHPILVAVERQHPAVAAMAHRLDRIQDGLGRKRGIRCIAAHAMNSTGTMRHSFREITLLECQPCDFPDLSH